MANNQNLSKELADALKKRPYQVLRVRKVKGRPEIEILIREEKTRAQRYLLC